MAEVRLPRPYQGRWDSAEFHQKWINALEHEMTRISELLDEVNANLDSLEARVKALEDKA